MAVRPELVEGQRPSRATLRPQPDLAGLEESLSPEPNGTQKKKRTPVKKTRSALTWDELLIAYRQGKLASPPPKGLSGVKMSDGREGLFLRVPEDGFFIRWYDLAGDRAVGGFRIVTGTDRQPAWFIRVFQPAIGDTDRALIALHRQWETHWEKLGTLARDHSWKPVEWRSIWIRVEENRGGVVIHPPGTHPVFIADSLRLKSAGKPAAQTTGLEEIVPPQYLELTWGPLSEKALASVLGNAGLLYASESRASRLEFRIDAAGEKGAVTYQQDQPIAWAGVQPRPPVYEKLLEEFGRLGVNPTEWGWLATFRVPVPAAIPSAPQAGTELAVYARLEPFEPEQLRRSLPIPLEQELLVHYLPRLLHTALALLRWETGQGKGVYGLSFSVEGVGDEALFSGSKPEEIEAAQSRLIRQIARKHGELFPLGPALPRVAAVVSHDPVHGWRRVILRLNPSPSAEGAPAGLEEGYIVQGPFDAQDLPETLLNTVTHLSERTGHRPQEVTLRLEGPNDTIPFTLHSTLPEAEQVKGLAGVLDYLGVDTDPESMQIKQWFAVVRPRQMELEPERFFIPIEFHPHRAQEVSGSLADKIGFAIRAVLDLGLRDEARIPDFVLSVVRGHMEVRATLLFGASRPEVLTPRLQRALTELGVRAGQPNPAFEVSLHFKEDPPLPTVPVVTVWLDPTAARPPPPSPSAGLEERQRVQEQIRAMLQDLVGAGLTAQVVDGALAQEFPGLAVLAQLHSAVRVDQSAGLEETNALVAELVSRDVRTAFYYSRSPSSNRALRFQAAAPIAGIQVETPQVQGLQALLVRILAILSGLEEATVAERVNIGELAAWLDRLA